jgi:hypothetical protein
MYANYLDIPCNQVSIPTCGIQLTLLIKPEQPFADGRDLEVLAHSERTAINTIFRSASSPAFLIAFYNMD